MADYEPNSLRTLFAAVCSLRKQLETLSSTSQQYHDAIQSALSRLQSCQELADSLSLFSSNETIDDVSTSDIPFLSIAYYIGDLTTRQPFSPSSPSPSARIAILLAAQSAYSAFLRRLDAYDLLSGPEQALLERFTESPSTFALLEHRDAARKREAKIAKHQYEKDLEQKLSYLRRDSSALDSDDGTRRALYRAELSLHAHRAFHALDQIAQELAILALAPSDPQALADGTPDARKLSRANGGGYSERLDPPLAQLAWNGRAGPILSKEGRPLQPFTLLDSRQRLQDGVFRPDHNLPTMTIDEYLEVEKKRGGIIDGGRKNSGRRQEVDEDDFGAADRETMKAREWDEFKEANPRGAGNTLNRG